MTDVDFEWVLAQLQDFITAARPVRSGGALTSSVSAPAAGVAEILARLEVIEPILDRFYAGWRDSMPMSSYYRFNQQYEGAQRCLARLQQQEVLRTKLGTTAPKLSADELHQLVWAAAAPQWDSNHFAEAVLAAARAVNSRLQERLDRRDVSDKTLVEQAFTLTPAQPGKPRLRVMPPDESETYKSLQEGVRSFGVGCFQALRNPLSHLPPGDALIDFSRQEALERLAALSLLAGWIDSSTLEHVDEE